MSNNNWERGDIRLPSAEVARIKKVCRDTANAVHAKVLADAKAFYDSTGRTRSCKKYEEALHRRVEAVYNRRPSYAAPRTTLDVEHLTQQVLESLAGRWPADAKPRMAKVADVEQIAPKATNRTTVFPIGESEGSISFNGNVVTYNSGYNNRQVERARAHPVAQAFFAALRTVKWTRGTGGELYGNDEMNGGDDPYEGRGGDYVTQRFGPEEQKRQQEMDRQLARMNSGYGYARRGW